MDVFITDFGAFLPNAPVSNEQMEKILGMVNQLPSRTRRIILRNNKITSRHYAIDPATGRTTHSNAQLAAEAIRRRALSLRAREVVNMVGLVILVALPLSFFAFQAVVYRYGGIDKAKAAE